MGKNIITINAGSSSVKFTVYDTTGSNIFSGEIKNIGLEKTNFKVNDKENNQILSEEVEASSHAEATKLLTDWITKNLNNDEISAIGHRVVHGGPDYCSPIVIDDQVLNNLTKLIPLDPDHLPVEIELINALKQVFPKAIQVACFDTAFHHDMPAVAQLLPIPKYLRDKGLKRYGFHGLSYEYIMSQLASQNLNAGKVVVAHLGSGSSLAAIKDGRSIDTTMGLSPAGGLIMSTRSGDIDPSLVVYLARYENFDAEQLNDLFNNKSGLLGLSGESADMKYLIKIEDTNPDAKNAVDMFCYQVKQFIGSYAATMGGIDRLVFTGGIGEAAPKIRQRVCESLQFLGIDIDESLNQAGEQKISSGSSRVPVFIIPTDESKSIFNGVNKIINT